MPSRKTSTSELTEYFTRWLDIAFQAELITRHRRVRIIDEMGKILPALVDDLNVLKKGKITLGSRTLFIILRDGRDPIEGNFNLFEMRWSKGKRPKRLRCFVGHRFTKSISNSLRHNLRHVLEPSNIKLVWSGMDMNAVGFFDEIVRQIRRADFCIFDNRSADAKPNVYIETGVAYVLRKPFIFANYQNNFERIPSDLGHILTIPYRDYRDLTMNLYFNLPVFLKHSKLRKAH